MDMKKAEWWKNAVVYQIYPKSFQDSNGDGIGDLQGIIQRIDYIKRLGADVIWLCPVYCSPMDDGGYDISDYYHIDPMFGTDEDMDELIQKADAAGIKILMDLVINHTSDEHEWFQNALKDPDSRYADYYIFRETEDGNPPNNWRSYFGDASWTRAGDSSRYYLHAFSKKQPDLNWENKELREEIYRMVNYWLDKGLGGFRIDAIINIKKALPFRNYEPDREDGLCSVEAMLKDAEGIGEFLKEMRDRTFKKYDAFSVGEVFNEKPEEFKDFIGEDGYFSSMFDFNETIFGSSEKGWYDTKPITPDDYKKCCFDAQRRIGNIGFLSNVIENHDEPRGVSRYIPEGDLNDKSKKMLAALNFMLRGIPFIYQGQELGMENMSFSSIEEMDDISSKHEYQVALDAGLTPKDALNRIAKISRDNARTPMQWSDEANAGFTTGTPWLKVNPNYTSINAASQTGDPESVRSFYKKLIALRKDPEYKETIVYGDFEPLWETRRNLMAYCRQGDKLLFVIGNYRKYDQSVTLLYPYKKVLLNNYPDIDEEGKTISLYGYQVLILEM